MPIDTKLVHLYGRLNQNFMSAKSESLLFERAPSVEHIMPQAWVRTWPLPDGTEGMDLTELYDTDTDNDDPRAAATRKRDTAIQTLGNLTILSNGLNSAQSNLPWDKKSPR